jgi:hypothetical protein
MTAVIDAGQKCVVAEPQGEQFVLFVHLDFPVCECQLLLFYKYCKAGGVGERGPPV